MPKLEIFVTELVTLTDPIWVGDLIMDAKNRLAKIFRLIFAISLFSPMTAIGLNFLPMTEPSAKIIYRELSIRYGLFAES